MLKNKPADARVRTHVYHIERHCLHQRQPTRQCESEELVPRHAPFYRVNTVTYDSVMRHAPLHAARHALVCTTKYTTRHQTRCDSVQQCTAVRFVVAKVVHREVAQHYLTGLDGRRAGISMVCGDCHIQFTRPPFQLKERITCGINAMVLSTPTQLVQITATTACEIIYRALLQRQLHDLQCAANYKPFALVVR